MLNDSQKTFIQTALKTFVGTFPSQTIAASNINGASEALISQMLNGNWARISDEAWRTVGKQCGASKTQWVMVSTKNYKRLTSFFDDAKINGNVHAITGNTGCGKSFSAENYAKVTENVFHIECAEYWNKKLFLQEILRKMGRDTGGNLGDMMANIIAYLLRLDEPLLILDEADKLSNDVLYFFITLYNKLGGNCGIVLMATGYLQTRIQKDLHKKGFSEIYSRLGRKFIGLKVPPPADVSAICNANGIVNEFQVSKIINESEGDLRRVQKSVHREKTVSDKLAA